MLLIAARHPKKPAFLLISYNLVPDESLRSSIYSYTVERKGSQDDLFFARSADLNPLARGFLELSTLKSQSNMQMNLTVASHP